MTSQASAPPRRKRTAMEVLRELRQPKVAVTLALGFSSGLPFLLTANTLGYWLRDEGTGLKAIGFISWVGLAYSLKWLWSPVVDRVDLPLLGRLGRRRGWMAFAQILVAAGLVGIAIVGPKGPGGLTAIGAFALLTAFASATQDIAIDAWRIEAASDSDEQGLLSSAAALGYRAAIIAADALILAVAARIGWPGAYVAYGAAMSIGLVATWFALEPARAQAALKAQAPLWNPRGFFDAVVGPFVDFFAQHKALGFLMLIAIATYRLPDFVMGPMYTPYYVDLGLTKDAVAAVRGSIGLFGALAGVAIGGLSAVRLGLFPTLITGAILQGLGTASFALLALYPGNVPMFGAVMGGDNFVQGYAGVALIAYMSSLTSLGYTATQYALLSSAYALLGKFLKGFSGVIVEGLAKTYGQMPAYEIAFVGAGLIAIPALVLFLLLARVNRRTLAMAPA
ncbi:MAG TPA: MFS transporter [Phenylobacterium sp.]|jgi:PAT family beta-lactamase induction signal transducer AmpG|uniref:AmpG family muropeptide MFS transporter n=1 Tax=Phenylobacterium sp. TaxID=1871053 RepID=UPI002CA8F473|nr:MFS transporter [Phenylobacterium sp.]HXA40928.1 MFS transporter [Phenylobacterium sp.]